MDKKNGIKLEKRIIFDGILKSKTPFRIGATEVSDIASDNPVLLVNTANENKVPIITSNTLKGLFRSEYERIIMNSKLAMKSQNQENSIKICNKETKISDLKDKNGKIIHSCPVCELFGSLIKKGKIKFYDAYFLGTESTFDKKTRIGINRKSKTTLKGQLAFVQTISPLQEFRFKMMVENVDESLEEFKILCFIISELIKGRIKIGGMKSAGLGLFTIDNLKIKIYDYTKAQTLDIKPTEVEFQEFYNSNYRDAS